MGRIRTIKPEFPQSESVGRLSRDARLLFILLWTIADDAGRARAASRGLASLLFPYDDDAPSLVGAWLDELEAGRFIRRYEVGGSTYLEIVKWLEHQKIDKPSASKFPAFAEGSRVVAEPSRSVVVGPRTKDQGSGTKEEDQDSWAIARATRPAVMAEVQKLFEEFWTEYPKREGANPKAPALKSFLVKIATGKRGEFDRETAAAMIAGAKRYAAELRSQGKYGTPYVARAVTFLNEQRWKDYPEVADVPALPLGKFYAAVESQELDAWDKHFRDTRGRGIPRDKAGGWLVDSQWPPGHVLADGGQNTEARAQQIELR